MDAGQGNVEAQEEAGYLGRPAAARQLLRCGTPRCLVGRRASSAAAGNERSV